MALFKDTNGNLRKDYLGRMLHAETVYNQTVQVIKDLRGHADRNFVSGTEGHREVLARIKREEENRDRQLAEFHAYAAALTAVSTALLAK